MKHVTLIESGKEVPLQKRVDKQAGDRSIARHADSPTNSDLPRF
jgi:hypothetical protein